MRLVVLWGILIFLAGCGGFEDQSSSSGSSTSSTLSLVDGTVTLPSGSAASLSQVSSRASISRAVATPVAGARISVFSIDDPFFEQDLLLPGELVRTNLAGNFLITRSQVQASALAVDSPTFIIRATVSDLEISSLVSLPAPISGTTPPLQINPISDGAIRFLKEEILVKFGGISNSSKLKSSSFLEEYKVLSLEFADRRVEIQSEFEDIAFEEDDLKTTTPISQRESGLLFSKRITELTTAVEFWGQLGNLRENLKLSAVSTAEESLSDATQRQRWRVLQLLYTALENGFFINVDGSRFLVKDRWHQLEKTTSPTLNAELDPSNLTTYLGSAFTTDDLISFPVPPGIMDLDSQLLNSFRNLGPSQLEKTALIAIDSFSSPWISTKALQQLASLERSKRENLIKLSDLLSAASLGVSQKRWSIERVQKQLSSGGLIYFGEEVGPPQHVGGNSVSPGLWETPITAIPLQSDTETDFHSFLEIDNVTMSLLEPAFRSEYGKLKDAQKSLSDQNNGYPDPVSRQGTRNIVFRLIQNLRTFQSPRSERSVKLLRRIFSSLHAARSLSKDLSPSTVLSSSEIFPILGTLPYLSWPLESSKGFFTSIQGTSTVSGPNLENLGFARIQPHLAQQTWSSILRSADPSASLSGVGDLTSLEVTLRTLSITSLPYLSVDQSGSLSVTVSGKIVLGIRNGQRIPAQGFLVEAIDAQPANNTASLSAQTDSTGLFQFQLENRLSGDRTYHLKVEVKDSGLSQSSSLSLSFPYSIIGFEGELKLPEFILEPEFQAQASAYSGDLLEIQASNRPPLVSLRSLPGLTSDIVPLSLILTDTESDPVKVKFSFTSGQSLTITTLHPRISLASTDSVQTTFPLSGTFASLPTSAGGAEITLYWFSKQEPGLESLENQSNLRIRFEIEESLRPVVKGAGIQSEFFDLDNIPPTITFDTPLRDTREPQATDFPEVSLERITLTGGASDRSEIQSIFARNTSYSAGPETTFAATNTGDQLSTWKIDQFPVEPDITNTVEFFAVDGFGNQNQDPVTATFRSLDSNPPIIHITTMTVFSTRNVPLISSVDPLIPMSITTSAGTGSIQLSIQTTSNSWSVDVITTRRIFFEGTAADPGGVSRVRFNSEAAEKFGTSDLNVGWNYSLLLPNEDGENQSIRFSAEDKKNNDSNTTNPSEFFKRKRGIDILFRLIDISAPAIILESTSGFVKNSALTVTTDVIQLSGGAADRSQITSFYLCSTLECRPVSTSNSYLMWDVSLPISQSSSNPITGLIEDEFGFRDNFQGANFLTQADLNDISPPSFVVTSVNGIAVTNTLVIDESYAPLGRPTSTTVYTASACNTLSCSLVISGLIQDESGFVLNSDGLSNFDEFNLRMAHLGSTQAEFNPDSYDTGNPTSSIEALIGSTIGDFFANSANTSTISVISTQSLTSSTQILTSLGFQAVLDFQDDGYWPVSLFLQDGSKEIFTQSGRQAPNIRKREIIYVLKDTIPPEIQLISAGTNSISSSSLVRLRGEIRDQLNTIDSLLINDVLITSADWITLNTTSPWNNFVSLPSQTAIEFQTDIILKAGLSQSIRITAADSLGNTTEFNTSLSVFPIFTTSIVPQFPYDDPTNVAFGGANLTSVFVGDAEKSRVEERSFSATLIRTISGNAKSNFYSQVSDFENFDAFFPRGGNTDSQSLVINSVFSDTTTTHKEVVRLFKETAQSFLDQFITREVNPLPTSNYDVFRDSQDSSSSNLISSTSSKVRFTPFQESVVYLFRATSEANSDQLFRYVKSLLNDPALASNPPSAGGTPTSTGVLGPGTNPVEISSQVSALVITQALSRNTDNEVTSSIEWVYLADRGLQRIDKFQFLNDGRLRGLTPIDLSTGEVIIDPTAMEIEPSGAVAYIGSGTDQRIYKLDITATPPSLITSFGGQGYSDGSFLSIDSIRGFQPENEGNFNELYVVDRTSRRISRFTSSGTLSQYFGDNPFTSGGMVAPVLLGLVDDEWLLLDSTLEFVDFRSISSDELNRNVTTTSLSISSLTSALAFEQTPEMKEESLTNLSALTYTTGLSGEIFSSTTRETFFLQGPNKLHHVVESTFQSFIRTNVNDQAFLPAGISTSTIEVFTAGSSPFEQVLDMSLLVDGSSLNLYVLENHSNDKYRVQLLSFTDQAQSDTASTADLSQVSSTGLCSVTSGLVIVGTNPQGNIDFVSFPANSTKIVNSTASTSITPKDLRGADMTFTSPGPPSCLGNHIAIPDGPSVRVFEVSGTLPPTIREVQRIDSVDSTSGETLSASLDVLLADSYLYILEKDRDRVLKYTVK